MADTMHCIQREYDVEKNGHQRLFSLKKGDIYAIWPFPLISLPLN